MYRRTYLEVDLDKLKNNLNVIREYYNSYNYYIGVVKNNCYGHGINCIRTMKENGINYFAVSSLEEALDIRKIDSEVSILVLEPITIEGARVASENDVTITIDNIDYYNKLKDMNLKIKYHIKLDTGMNRFGTKNKDNVTYMFNDNSSLELEGIYTHLTIGVEDSEMFNKHIENFKYLTSDIDLSKVKIVHLDRSLTLEQHKKIEFANGVRLGLIMYGYANRGYYPSFKAKVFNLITKFKKLENVEPNIKLDPIASFKSTVLEIKEVMPGEVIGYLGAYNTKEKTKIALLAYGFADYLYNNLSSVSINGKLYKTIVINMDVTFVVVDDSVKVGDEVTIFGKDLSIYKKCNDVNQNLYKVLTSVTNRVPRLYKENDKKIEIKY